MIYHHLRVKRRNEVVKNENNTVHNPARAIDSFTKLFKIINTKLELK